MTEQVLIQATVRVFFFSLCWILSFLLFCVTLPPAGTPLPPGTPTIPLSQLQSHSLALQGQHGQAPQSAQGQQAVFRFPAAVSLTGDPLELHHTPACPH